MVKTLKQIELQHRPGCLGPHFIIADAGCCQQLYQFAPILFGDGAGGTFSQENDAQSIPLEDESFDAVIANHMLYHVPDRPKAIAEIGRVLKPGGWLIATTVGRHHLEQMMARYRQVHVSNAWESFANPFTLENGREQLEPYFSRVNLFRYGDSLQVTEIQPLMDYILSTIKVQELPKDKLGILRQTLVKELEEKGSIFITKDSGLFEAIK